MIKLMLPSSYGIPGKQTLSGRIPSTLITFPTLHILMTKGS